MDVIATNWNMNSMSETKPVNEASANDKPGPGFYVGEQWPARGVGRAAKSRAVQALVAGHTLIVGQSRSGKTNAARRIIEEIICWTDARVVILDPNADFRFLNEVDPKLNREVPENKHFADKWSGIATDIEIATPDGGGVGNQMGSAF